MPERRLACMFVDGVENAGTQSLHFIGGAHDHILLDVPGAVAELCIWVSVEAQAAAPLRKLALSLWAHGMEIDWITYEDAAVAPPEGRHGPAYTVDHIFSIPAWLTFRDCVFEVRAAGDNAAIGTALLTLELPPPF
ncbi:hypothetical protein GJV26_07400 [Massilia dura]|uniref:Uncharacterized protein n=1 Tax=Pseudoduganella dura TaxID=321982 RepID=A0A6I3XDL8_9BURK|nr:hypothetical protein [Pseudoduganella dura]MUI12303.1 hypothetical protein [Pseudoduganella dura]GGY07151.1 hypothetical protein GCM10007386_42090 [Pseudoduganella dura]